MSSPSTPERGRPARIDSARTVDTALRLLDEAGLDALTMRGLADALGVQAGALYRYFATKHDLLTAMAERMLEGAAGPGAAAAPPDSATAPTATWDSRVAGLARALRTALLAHRDGARVYAGTHSTGPNTLGFSEAVLAVLRDAGFDDADATRALLTLVNFTVGHTLEEQATLPEGPASGADTDAKTEPLRRGVAAAGLPHLTAALPTLTSTDFSAHFEFGLELLLQGLRTRHRG
ncbi:MULTISPECIES: TetR/AcrR family transcriptional regulator [Streptomyces]|uniref:TetR/AcrR family transcriptional regulator n=1 Tax=Streptomyces albus TaxID=1888 RepID=A0A8H1LP78_9ACTN|nr:MULTISPECIES: TetR/AcrR family transcriptional regulator [Streptomyces]EPD95874.1 hypothetical protein HMPREF1486_01404 [Streptomyces sp. HPH0547]TGG89704.1 TetR/AcrR family transcriptional regulator [Streptomyces albus]UVN57422.1 TetR/AcrR family transcriptional regulator [Streptomyces albus]